MTTYAVGDIQGCFEPLQRLLAELAFEPGKDTLWLAGDLVNRGPESLRTLRYVHALGDAAQVVLGNHDLHLLAASVGAKKLGKKDTIEAILKAPDSALLLDWLRRQPLLHVAGEWALSHAGVPHIWSVAKAREYAGEVQQVLSGQDFKRFMFEMYGNEPDRWHESLEGASRWRVITNYLTRMRFIWPDGRMDFKAKEGLESAPEGASAWFTYERASADARCRFLFGHWAALEGTTGDARFNALDTGCVWGRELSALDLTRQERISVPAQTDR